MTKSGRCFTELFDLPVETLPLRVLRFLAANQLNGRDNAQLARRRVQPWLFAAGHVYDRTARGGNLQPTALSESSVVPPDDVSNRIAPEP